MSCQTTLEGKYYGKETITYYNTNTMETTIATDEFIFEIKQIGEDQFLGDKITLTFNNQAIPRSDILLMFVKDSNGWTSGSYTNAIDRLFYENGQLVYVWTNQIYSNGILTNAKFILNKII